MNAINNQTDKIQTIQAEATALIVEQLQEFETTGQAPAWLQPWDENGGLAWPCNLDGTPYSGINVIQLLAIQKKRGYPRSTWGTYKAYQDKGGQVLKGEKSGSIFFYKSLVKEAKDENGNPVPAPLDDAGQPLDSLQRQIRILKFFSVFNLAQTGLEQAPAPVPSENFAGLAAAIRAAGVDVRHGTDKAYHDRQADF